MSVQIKFPKISKKRHNPTWLERFSKCQVEERLHIHTHTHTHPLFTSWWDFKAPRWKRRFWRCSRKNKPFCTKGQEESAGHAAYGADCMASNAASTAASCAALDKLFILLVLHFPHFIKLGNSNISLIERLKE